MHGPGKHVNWQRYANELTVPCQPLICIRRLGRLAAGRSLRHRRRRCFVAENVEKWGKNKRTRKIRNASSFRGLRGAAFAQQPRAPYANEPFAGRSSVASSFAYGVVVVVVVGRTRYPSL